MRNKLLNIAISVLILIGFSWSIQRVDIAFDPDPATWERNSVVTAAVVLTAADEAVNVAGVELHFDYDSSKFKTTPVIIQDNFIGSLFVSDVDTSTPGRITYRKAKAYPAYQTIPAFGSLPVFVLEFSVTSVNSAEGVTNFTFDSVIDDVVNRAGSSVKGTINNGTYTIVADTIPPVINAVPISTTMNSTTQQNIVLAVSGSDRAGDLQYIKYTVDGNTPDEISTTYAGPITLPANQTTTLRFRGRDYDNNWQATQTEIYTLDTNAPVVSNISVVPNNVKRNSTVIINFRVSEPLAIDPTVRVAGQSASKVAAPTPPDYQYIYIINGTEPEGNQNVSIEVQDLAGNIAAATPVPINIDYRAPTYSIVSISPAPVTTGNPVTVVFKASEQLANTSVVNIMGHYASRTNELANGDGTYTYTYISPLLTGSETTALITVSGIDLAGNNSSNLDGWGNITATGVDLYGNTGSGTANVEFDFEE